MRTKAICNAERLVIQYGMGVVRQPYLRLMPWQISHEGVPMILPRMGSITLNVQIGDSVYSMEGDHVEPGVSIKNPGEEENNALNLLSCIGNPATVISGAAKGEKGFVTGSHGGVEDLLIYFPRETLEKMTVEDKVQVRMQGRGMKIQGFEDTVHCISVDPQLFEKMDIMVEDGRLVIPVAARIPAHLMGSGMGEFSAVKGDYDIMTADREEIRRLHLDRLRYGDIVLLENCDNTYGRGYLKGAVSIGVVIHGDCIFLGHGPGVSTMFSAKTPVIEGRLDCHANLADLMGVSHK